jgi:Outer membrane lipoprotein-sorting protein
MYKFVALALVLTAALTTLGIAQNQSFKTGLEVMQAADARPKPKSSTGTISLEISKNTQTLSRSMKSWASGDKSLIKFLAPADVKGSGILSIKTNGVTETKLYLPALGRVRRLATGGGNNSDCDGAFFGSDFSYCDLGNFELSDYSFNLLSNEGGKYSIEAKPKKSSSYDKLIFEIEAKTLNTLKTDYYKGEKIFKTLRALELGTVKSYNVIKSLSMETPSQGSKSTFKQTSFDVDVTISESVFTERFLMQP